MKQRLKQIEGRDSGAKDAEIEPEIEAEIQRCKGAIRHFKSAAILKKSRS